jgi:hypothetical protein
VTFHINQKIECIRDDWHHPLAHLVQHLPRKRGIYHVRGFDLYYPRNAYLRLVEIVNPMFLQYDEPSFFCGCFRPVIERKTDIGVFRKLLNPIREIANG